MKNTELEGYENMKQTQEEHNNDLEYLLRMAQAKDKELEGVLAYAADGIGKFACDENFTILYYNDGLARLVGTTRGRIEKEGFNSSLYIHTEDIEYVHKETVNAMNNKEAFEMRYRLKHITGKSIWVKVKGIFMDDCYKGIYPIMYLLYTDITELVETNEKLQFEKERYKAFTSLVHEQFFEYDASNEQCPLILFGGDYYDEDKKAAPTKENIKLFLDSLGECENLIELEVLLFNNKHELNWYHISAKGLKKENNTWNIVIGRCENIQRQKEIDEWRRNRERELIKYSEIDSLTDLFNRYGLEKSVNRVIEEYDEYVCGVIDIDNFKRFNDLYGHVFGDEVLKYVANVLKNACDIYDFVGRIGGDEFFIFFEEIDKKKIKERLGMILKEVAKSKEKLSISTEVSVSIGAVIVSKISTDFVDIYHHADTALYKAKRKGKNTYSLDLYSEIFI